MMKEIQLFRSCKVKEIKKDFTIKCDDLLRLIDELDKTSFIKYYKSLETSGLIIKDKQSKGVLITTILL